MLAKISRGEIININYQYKIAFTDLSNYSLSDGDIVEVLENNKAIDYLEVSEASDAISKLSPVQNNKNYSTKNFSAIKIGFTIIKREKKTSQSSNTYNTQATGQKIPTSDSFNKASTLKTNVQTNLSRKHFII